MKTYRFFAAFTASLFLSVLITETAYAQGSYLGPDYINNPSHESQYGSIVGPPSIDTIAITAPAPDRTAPTASQLYILREGNQGARERVLDASDKVSLIEDFQTSRIAVRFCAFHTDYYEVKLYNELRDLVFWKKGAEIFSGEQVIIPYHELEGGRYFLHIDTNDGSIIKQHLYKPYQYHTSSQ